MAKVADGKQLLSESAISRIADVDRSRRRVWAKAGAVRRRGNQGYTEIDAVESAAFKALVTQMDYERALEAWEGAREPLRELMLTQPLLVVFDEGRGEASIATAPHELFAFAGRPGRYRVIDISAAVGNARLGFRSAIRAKERSRKPSKVQQLRKKSAKQA